MTCPECAHEVSDLATQCPNCSYPIKSEKDKVVSNQVNKELDPKIKWNHFSWSTLLFAVILFALPFCNINCSGTKVLSLTGVNLVTGKTIEGTDATREMPSNIWAIAALSSIGLAFLISIFLQKTHLITGLLGIAGIVFLISLQMNINLQVSQQPLAIISVDYEIAYWASIALTGFAAIINFSTFGMKKDG